mgnify:CR=1 FL=1
MVRDEHVTSEGSGVGVYEIDVRLSRHPVVALFVLAFNESSDQLPLMGTVRPLGPHDSRCIESPHHSCEPLGLWHTVGVGETQYLTLSSLRSPVPSRRWSGVGLTNHLHTVSRGYGGGTIG